MISMNIIKIEGKIYKCASSWNELAKKELLLWCGVLQLELTVVEALELAVWQFYRIPKKVFVNLSASQRAQLRSTLTFLEHNKLTANVLGSLRVLGLKYCGPAHRLANLTIGEFRRTELYYSMYMRSADKHFLYLLAATLFRRRGNVRGDDMRCELSEKTVIRNARLFSWGMHPNALKAIQLFYEGARADIQKRFDTVFQKSTDTASTVSIQDWEDRILAFSGDKLGSFKETNRTNLYIFLKHMTDRIKEYERQKK